MQNESILLYPKQVQKLLGIGPTKFYELVKLPDFPKPRSLFDHKRSVYLRNEIMAWANNLEKTEIKKGTGGLYVGGVSRAVTQASATENN